MINLNYNHKNILNYLRENRKKLIPFIGSGFSYNVAPSWSDLINNLFTNNSIDISPEIENMAYTNPLEAMEYFIWSYADKIKNEGVVLGKPEDYYQKGKIAIIEYLKHILNFKVDTLSNGKKIHKKIMLTLN